MHIRMRCAKMIGEENISFELLFVKKGRHSEIKHKSYKALQKVSKMHEITH